MSSAASWLSGCEQYGASCLIEPCLVWRQLTSCIFRQAGKLNFAQELFLMDSTKMDLSGLPAFHRSLLNAWQAFGCRRDPSTYTEPMFFNEPQFHNSLFEGNEEENALIQQFTNSAITKVCHLKNATNDRWLSATALATEVGIRSCRKVDSVLKSVLHTYCASQKVWKKNPSHTHL